VTDRASLESRTASTAPDIPMADVEFLLRFARTAHEAGYPTADLEERILALARVLDLAGVEVSATPTLIEISLGSIPDQRTYTLRMRPATVDLAAIAELDDLVRDVLEQRLATEAALAALAEHGAPQGSARPVPLLLAAYALAGGALTPVLGGGWREAAAAAGVGLFLGGIALPAARAPQTEPMVAPVAGVVASFLALALARLGFSGSPDVVTLAALVTFLPGMRLTIGMRELSTEHLQSGVANIASALVQLLGLVFGVGVGRSIAESWFGPSGAVVPETSFGAVYLLAAVAAGLAFTLTLRARSRDAVMMCAATTLALGARELAAGVFGDEAAVFVAALVIGVVGGLVGWRLRRSPLVFIVPGVLMLVPGSAGFTSALQLLANQTVSGIAAAFDTFVTAMSIAYGLMVATLILPGRLSYATPRATPEQGSATS
jgi:uncharacterized membrane protein YjjP (DUF1212 family)